MKILTPFLSGILLLTACTHGGRHIASAPLIPPHLDNFLAASEVILNDVEDARFPEYCVSYLKELEINIDSMSASSAQQELKQNAEALFKASWEIRNRLHKRLSEFDKDCSHQIVSSFRQFRFLEDYFLEISRDVEDKLPAEIKFQEQPIPMIANNIPYYSFLSAPDIKLEAGDILVSRGMSFISGMIARLGVRPTHFSHLIMVHEDSETKKLQTIESYIGVGVGTYDLDYALKNENVRILWLRPKDREMGKKASYKMAELLKEKKRIRYDYSMDFEDQERMSCSEVVKAGYQMASSDFKVPYYPNEILDNSDLVKRLKLVHGETFEPGDMEIDPRFELMGEFRDIRLTRDARQKDAIMSAIFNWLENKNYVLKDNMESYLAGSVIFAARKTFLWPLIQKTLKIEDFSKEIPPRMLRTVQIMNTLGAELLEELKKRDAQFESQNGVPMTYMDFAKNLEEMRIEDLSLYQNKKTRKLARIHKLIRPRK